MTVGSAIANTPMMVLLYIAIGCYGISYIASAIGAGMFAKLIRITAHLSAISMVATAIKKALDAIRGLG